MIILQTDRMLLRHLVPGDLHDLYEILGDPVAMEYYPAPKTLEETKGWIDTNIGRYTEDGFGMFAMVRKDDNTFLGNCGPVRRTIEGVEEVEIGYQVLRKYHGQGYATEAACACMEYCFTTLGLHRVISLIRPENRPSWRVAEKNGMTVDREIQWFGLLHRVYYRLRDDTVNAE